MACASHNDQRPLSVISLTSWKESSRLNWSLTQWELPGKRGDTPQRRKERGLGDKRQEHPLTMNLRMPVRVCKPNYPDLCPYLWASPFALPQNNWDLAYWAEGLRGNFLCIQLSKLEGSPPGGEHRGQQWLAGGRDGGRHSATETSPMAVNWANIYDGFTCCDNSVC